MKKTIAFFLCFVTVFLLASCGAPAAKTDFDVNSLKTLGDMLKLEEENEGWAYDETRYVNVFQYGGTTYRVYADLTEEIYNKIEEIDFFDEQREQKMNDILADVKITAAEDMTKYIPTEADLQKYVGKTGQELLDDDFWTSGYWLYDEQHFFMGHDLCEFNVYFNEKIEFKEDEADDFDEEEAIRNLTVKKLEFTGFSGRATDLD